MKTSKKEIKLAIDTLITDAKKVGFVPVKTINNQLVKLHCPKCQADTEKLVKIPLSRLALVLNFENAIVFKNDNGDVIHRCICGYGKRIIKKKKDHNVTTTKVQMCKQCGKNPIPPGRTAKCYECWPPKKRTSNTSPAKEEVSKPIY